MNTQPFVLSSAHLYFLCVYCVPHKRPVAIPHLQLQLLRVTIIINLIKILHTGITVAVAVVGTIVFMLLIVLIIVFAVKKCRHHAKSI